MKHLTAFVFGLVVLGLIGWIGTRHSRPSGNSNGGRPKIVWVNPLAGHPVYVMQTEAFLVAAEDYGFDPVCVGPSQIDAEQSVQEIENAIAQRVDGIVTVPYSWSSFGPVLKKAQEAGVPVVCTGADTPEDWRIGYVGTDTVAYGKQAAQYLIARKKGKARICIMHSRLDVQNQVETRKAFEETIRPYPEMIVTIVDADKADMSIAVEKFQNIFRAYPEIDTVLDLEATGAAAAAQVAGEMGITDRITILTIDDVDQTIDEIRKGRIWGTMAQNFYRMGYESAAAIMDHLAGRSIPSRVDSGTLLITRDNVKTYKKDMLQAVRRKPGARSTSGLGLLMGPDAAKPAAGSRPATP
jgi:ABC-type sugar transport system substrate-binding protein